MRQTFKVRFYCRESRRHKDGLAPVEVSIIVSGTREVFSLPKACDPDEFPTEDLRLYCTGVENRINSIYTSLSLSNEPITAFILKDIFLNGTTASYTLKKLFSDGLELKAKEDPSVGTYRKYEIVRDAFYEHTGYQEAKEASSITYADILTVKAKLDGKFKPATVQKMLMRLKYFFLLAFNSGKIKSNPFAAIRIRRPETENIFLTEEELQRLIDAEIVEDKYDRARDIFVFMAGTGLEYADLYTLNQDSVQDYGNLHYIKGRRVKTGVEYLTVVQDFAMEVWQFYGGKIPKLSNQKLNVYLKKCQVLAKIDKSLSSIVARHTFGTLCLNRGLSMDVVSKMLGHTSTAQTKTYASLLDTSVLDANQALKKSPNKPLKISGGTSSHILRESSPEAKIASKASNTDDDFEIELQKLSEALGI